MASLVNNNGSWALIFTRNRRQKNISLHLKVNSGTKKTAEILKGKMEADFALGIFDPWAEKNEMKIESWDVAVTAFLKAKKPVTGKSGLDVYRYALKSFWTHSKPARPDSVKSKALENWYHSSDLSPATLNNYLAHLRAFFAWCIEARYSDLNPALKLKLRRHKSPDPEHFSQEMIDSLVNKMNDWYETSGRIYLNSESGRYYLSDIVRFAVMSGCRLNEITGLQWSDCDFSGKTIHIREPKNGHDRYIGMFPALDSLLSEIPRSGIYVFTVNGERLDHARLSKRFKAFCRELGFSERLHFHSLRHTTGFYLANNGVNQKMIQTHLGHLDGRMTNRYTKVDLEGIRKEIGRLF